MKRKQQDAWQIHDKLVKHCTKTFELRDNLRVEARAHKRTILINGTQHNLSTVEEYAEMLLEAVRFVADMNPSWNTTRKDLGLTSPPNTKGK
ncbi:hypothetical protein EKI60_06330 [Candidatus Saccharibacteria bacterium]|nr:MAG: hypothetical protein EKI60_06330 [Candidatus Saccharibacteria bacterium]